MSATRLDEFVRDQQTKLATLDPNADLADLEGLAEIVGDARVVAIGENNHLIREFSLLRHRMLRFLVQRCGFTVYCLESGFAEGWTVRRWLDGGPGEVADIAREGITFGLGNSPQVHDTLTWLREHRIPFYGADVPSSGGSPIPALRAVGELVPNAGKLVDAAIAAAQPYASGSSAVAPAKHAALDQAARDHATATVTRLYTYLQTQHDELALHHAEGALRLDQYLNELPSWGQDQLYGENSSRDYYMARTARWLLDRHGPDSRIVLAIHNGHLQRTPFTMGPATPFLPAGYHLARELGEDYRAIAITCGSGETTVPVLDADEPIGFTIGTEELAPAQPDTIEAAFQRVDSGPALLDLRPARQLDAPWQRIRHANNQIEVPVAEAFDAIMYLPTARPC
ncbi:MAG TPA: erythromycin esterase family protein [Pseudonocardiaceae bacterium]|nr:erythromycin esterase family protein [Pseudonocardiaceae bacterium]